MDVLGLQGEKRRIGLRGEFATEAEIEVDRVLRRCR
jgi:hypothetical protein